MGETERCESKSKGEKKTYLCFHAHFYQPPRENPWLDFVEIQDSAYPAHDWNERIARECYYPMAHARVLDAKGNIVQIVNNYERISFNIGPTLFSWLERHKPNLVEEIIRADQTSRSLFGGHGNAIAQVYNHIIMPLASERDARTQVRWSIREFEKRFGRRPEGMWLAERRVILAYYECSATRNPVYDSCTVSGGGGPQDRGLGVV